MGGLVTKSAQWRTLRTLLGGENSTTGKRADGFSDGLENRALVTRTWVLAERSSRGTVVTALRPISDQ